MLGSNVDGNVRVALHYRFGKLSNFNYCKNCWIVFKFRSKVYRLEL